MASRRQPLPGTTFQDPLAESTYFTPQEMSTPDPMAGGYQAPPPPRYGPYDGGGAPGYTPTAGGPGAGSYGGPVPPEWGQRGPGRPMPPGSTLQPAPGTATTPPAPKGTYDRTQTRDWFMSRTPTSDEEIQGWIRDNGFMEGVKYLGDGNVEMPNGERYDIWGNKGGSGQRGTWTPIPGRAGTEWASMPGQSGGGGEWPGGSGGVPPTMFGGGGGSGSGTGYATGSMSSSRNPVSGTDLQSVLQGLYGNTGGFNQDIVNRRTDNARGALEKGRKSRLATNRAMLADRGLIGDGAEATGANQIDEATFDAYTGAVNDIYSNESSAADGRMMEALSLATGMSMNDARLAVEQFRAQNDRDLGFANVGLGYRRADIEDKLGMGNLALGSQGLSNQWNLGMANYGLNRDRLRWDMSNGSFDQMATLLDLLMRGSNVSAGGYR